MKKYLIVLALTMTCMRVVDGSLMTSAIYRCENEEVICYTKSDRNSGIYCHFKGGIK